MRHAVLAILDARTIRAVNRRSRYADALRDVPPALLPFWRETAPDEFPGIPPYARFYARSLEALLSFFDCASRARRPCGLPSSAADSVWHAWLRLDPDGLERFCRHHFGRTIPHVASGDMAGQMGGALAVCLVEARKLDRQAPAAPTLPRLFALDRALRMPLGFGYTLQQGAVAFARLDKAGLPQEPARHVDQLAPYGLFAAGLISEAEYELGSIMAARRREDAAAQPDGGCGTLATQAGGRSADCADDGAGGDSGGAAGDGGSCGGGCGGD